MRLLHETHGRGLITCLCGAQAPCLETLRVLRMPGCGFEAADGEGLARALVSRGSSGAQGLKITAGQ